MNLSLRVRHEGHYGLRSQQDLAQLFEQELADHTPKIEEDRLLLRLRQYHGEREK